jgi:hypothetical protein
MSPAELYYFMGKCLSMDGNPAIRRLVEIEISSGNLSWEEFVWMGSSHFVLPALYSSLRRNGLLQLLPGELTEHLSAIHAINTSRNQQIIEQSLELVSILKQEGIEPVFLKGAGYLLQHLHPDPGDRIMSDIDILVPEELLENAARVLSDNGYFHPVEFEEADFEEHHHLPGFEHKNYVAMVELHHSIFPRNFQSILSNTEIFADKQKLESRGAWVMSVNHQMILNFVHDQLADDNFKYKTMLLKGLYDFYLLTELNPAGLERFGLKGCNSKFNTYCAFISSVFYQPKGLPYEDTYSARIFKRQFIYLLNHPKLYGFYQMIVLYAIRIPIILQTVITAPFSKQSRRYFSKKAGSLPAMRKYFKNLKEEI